MLYDKIPLKQIFLYEKAAMHPLNRLATYVLTPVYLVVSGIIIVVCTVVMEIDEKRFLPLLLILMGVFVLMSILLLACVPLIRKKVLQDEMDRYNFDFSDLPYSDVYEYCSDDCTVRFDENGMYVEDNLFYYNHLTITVVTSNYCHRIYIAVRFAADEENYIEIHLGARVLKMIRDLQIPVQNQNTLDYILSNKTEAFKHIYNKGYASM